MVAQEEVEEPYNRDFDASNSKAAAMVSTEPSDGSTEVDPWCRLGLDQARGCPQRR
jgi:hypothetical protein